LTKSNNSTFFKVTNKDIYESVNDIKEMLSHCQSKVDTNEKGIAYNRKMIYLGLGSALSLVVALVSAGVR